MLTLSILKDLLSQNLTDREKSLICLYVEPARARSIKEITDIAYSSGWRQVKKKNLSVIYSRAKGLACRLNNGWVLTSEGVKIVDQLTAPYTDSRQSIVAPKLRACLDEIKNIETQSFVEEAIICYESRQYRAAVVLSWIGAVAVLYNHVVVCKLADFNAEALRRNPKWKEASTVDDLGLIKEDTFLDILQSISVIGKNVKDELKKALILRNGCGHPNSLRVAEHKVSAHIEDLILNVFSRY